jgi:hypothetical protein
MLAGKEGIFGTSPRKCWKKEKAIFLIFYTLFITPFKNIWKQHI